MARARVGQAEDAEAVGEAFEHLAAVRGGESMSATGHALLNPRT